MLIYIRHGNDHADDSEHHHDRGLTDRAKKKASKLARRLIEKHDHPDIVHVSPFRRTLETIAAMSDRFERPVDVRHDVRLAQGFSQKQQRRGPDVSTATLRAGAPIHESQGDFERRITEHLQEMQLYRDKIVWCVTHTIIIERVAAHLHVKTGDLDFLDHLVIR